MHSLCFQRVGYFVGPAPLIAALDKIRDSYNVNGLGQVAAGATLDDLPYYRGCARKIIATRKWLSGRLEKLGARRIGPVGTWYVMAAPTGQRFCVVRAQRADFDAKANTWND